MLSITVAEVGAMEKKGDFLSKIVGKAIKIIPTFVATAECSSRSQRGFDPQKDREREEREKKERADALRRAREEGQRKERADRERADALRRAREAEERRLARKAEEYSSPHKTYSELEYNH